MMALALALALDSVIALDLGWVSLLSQSAAESCCLWLLLLPAVPWVVSGVRARARVGSSGARASQIQRFDVTAELSTPERLVLSR